MNRSACIVLAAAWAGTALGQLATFPYCQIADRQDEPVWHAALGHTGEAEVNDRISFSQLDWDGAAGLVLLPTDSGTIDIRARTQGRFFGGSGGIHLPDQVGSLALDLRWMLRRYDGYSFRFTFQPGFYTDFREFSGKSFFVPLGADAIYAFNEVFSASAGLMLYPGFDHFIDPHIGIRGSIYDAVIIDLFYPESKITFLHGDLWTVQAGYRIERYPEYQLDDSDGRDRLRIDEDRLFFRWSYAAFYDARLLVESGMLMNRDFAWEDGGQRGKADDALYFRVGVSAAL